MNKDQFANRFAVDVTESAPGTCTFTEVPTYSSAFSKEAFIIHRLEYSFSNGSLNVLVADSDMMMAALTTSNILDDLLPTTVVPSPYVMDHVQVLSHLVGAAANFALYQNPITRDFTSLPGGGLIVPARPLFVAVNSSGVAQACRVTVRGWFTVLELKADEYLELVDAYRIIV